MSPVVVNLVPFLSPHKRLHLFSCVARTPFYKCTEQTLHLVRVDLIFAIVAHSAAVVVAVFADPGKGGWGVRVSGLGSHTQTYVQCCFSFTVFMIFPVEISDCFSFYLWPQR